MIREVAEIRRTLGVLFAPDDTFEMRIFRAGWKSRQTLYGYFRDHDKAAAAAADNLASDVCVVLNPVKPALHARSADVLTEAGKGDSAGDEHVARRRWFFTDVDPKREDNISGISATDAERACAVAVGEQIRAYLADQGWPAPIVADSGNGEHTVYAIDLPNDQASTDLLKGILTGLAAKFDTDGADVDTGVFNAARLIKLWGTASLKGSNTDERQHRWSEIVLLPDPVVQVPLGTLQATLQAFPTPEAEKPAKAAPKAPQKAAQRPSSTASGTTRRTWTMSDFIAKHGIAANDPCPYMGGSKWQLTCPFDPSHMSPDAILTEAADGALGFKCSHKSCSGNKWEQFRRLHEPEAYDRKKATARPTDAAATDLDAALTDRSLDDLGLADRLIARHGEDIRYCEAEAAWYTWDGRVWARQITSAAAKRFGEATVDAIGREATTIPVDKGEDGVDKNEKRRETYAQFARSTRSMRKINEMVSLAQTRIDIQARPEDFDSNQWLLACQNGTLDLKTGILRPHDRSDLLTQSIPVDYDPFADAPLWETFLATVVPDHDVRDYLQRFVGYSLTGLTREQCYLFLHGGGQNGKGTFVDTVGELFGKLHARLDSEVITHTAISSGKARFGLGGILGRRLVTFSEVEERSRFNEPVLKALTGEDPIEIELKGKQGFTYQPHAKYVLAGNHKPTITGTDMGIWRRTRLIPFEVTIPDDQKDEALREKLLNELPGILVWALEGLACYLQGGLQTPATVLAATKEYREDSDVLGQFLAERCVTGDPDMRAQAAELYNVYAAWSDASGHRAIAMNNFAVKLKGRGYVNKHTKFGAVWIGIGLAADRDDDQGAAQQRWGRPTDQPKTAPRRG